MVLYNLQWGDRNVVRHTEWLGTKADLRARKAALNCKATKRPYDQIEILRSACVEVPTTKKDLLEFLNQRRVK